MKLKKVPFVITITFIFVMLFLITNLFLAGCSTINNNVGNDPNRISDGNNAQEAANNELSKLLPSKEGFTWVYNGFAEYGHRMTLESIEKAGDSFKYNISGTVDDPSGGEARDRDFSLEITYFIENGTLIQFKRESAMLDSDFDYIELIRYPLEEGNKWQQDVQRKDGSAAVLECTIIEVNEGDDAGEGSGTKNGEGNNAVDGNGAEYGDGNRTEGGKVNNVTDGNVTGTGEQEGAGFDSGANLYTVIYREKDSDYYEKRVFKEGVGLVSFEKLLVLQDQSFPAGYSLYEEISGYPK